MWTARRSVLLSKLGVLLFAILLLSVVVFAPWLVRWLVFFSRAHLQGIEHLFLATIYAGSVPAAVLLFNLFRLLERISSQEIFVQENVEYLRRISWSCFAGAGICLLSTLYYFPWILVAVPASFMGLIVRVVKNVVAQAVSLKLEADYTV